MDSFHKTHYIHCAILAGIVEIVVFNNTKPYLFGHLVALRETYYVFLLSFSGLYAVLCLQRSCKSESPHQQKDSS